MNVSLFHDSLSREKIVLIFGCMLCFYLTYHLLAGNRSYLRHMSLKSTIAEAEILYGEEKDFRESIENKVKMMRPDSVNHDFLEERVRRVLGYTYPEESMIIEKNQ